MKRPSRSDVAASLLYGVFAGAAFSWGLAINLTLALVVTLAVKSWIEELEAAA